MKELCIIGAGPIGLYAAFNAGLRKIDAFVLESAQLTGGQLNLYLEKTIYDVPGHKAIKTKKLLNDLYDQYKTYENDIPIYYNENVLSIEEKDDYFVITTNRKIREAKKILFTHGGGMFTPRKIEGLEAKNIHYGVYDLDRFKNKKVVVFGGGDSAVDWANLVVDVATSTHLIHRRSEFRAHKSSLDLFLSKKGIITTPYTLNAYKLEDENVKSITIKHKETNHLIELEVDEMIVCYGLIQTKTDYNQWLVRNEEGLIIVNTDMSSSVNGIYACGNGVTYLGKQKMLTSGFGEVVTAIGAINFELHPEQKVPKYSSLIKK
ncbi:NAD(P)/FAD-dependent oxidoreductase [Mycoplasmatota bacterium]|nr:NAD(P)/FAD-dependent oxidoreductase [Mycoplasmatota bacterium]